MKSNATNGSAHALQRGGSELSLLRRIVRSIAPAAVSAAPALAQPSASSFETALPIRRPRGSVASGSRRVRSATLSGSRDTGNGREASGAGPAAAGERSEQHSHRWVAPRYARVGKVWSYEPPHWSHQRL